MKNLIFKLIMWIVFVAIVTCPFWSVLLVMEATSFDPKYLDLNYKQHVHMEALIKANFKRVGLEVKYDQFSRSI